jgi:hypothetical protein
VAGLAARGARLLAMGAVPATLVLAGCGGGAKTTTGGGTGLSVTPGTVSVDTNCTGCNTSTGSGSAVEQFSAKLSSGSAATVTWAVSGGDALSGAGTISSNGQYTPPGYLSADSVSVTVTATLTSNASDKASATITVTPGFLQPLTPENAALGANGTVTVTGYIAEAGGSDGINYAVSSSATGSSGGEGTVSAPVCTRAAKVFTSCSATYTAPSTVSATTGTYIVATVGTSSSKTAVKVLLNAAGIDSDPSTHQATLNAPVALGSSGGNDDDFDTATVNGKQQVSDCCGGTLGALIQSAGGTRYLLSCNHVFARSDQASVGENIVQPGLIDADCAPLSNGGSETLVGTLSGFVKLKPATGTTSNVDAAIAQVESGAVSPNGDILELGAKQSNGTLAAAPPGVSSTSGKGETATVNMNVAKSGRTTGLTCAAVSSVAMSVQVSYFSNCKETNAYYTKTYTDQIVITGNQFSDAGDSGSLVVDASNAEPVGLFFAGGTNSDGVDVGIANPVSDVLSELSSQVGNGTAYTFVGTTDHPVSCLNYGNVTVTAARGHALASGEAARRETALTTARGLVNPSAGILGVATGKSSDHSGEGAVLVYVDQGMNPAVPQTVNGVRTLVIPTTAQAVNAGTAPRTPAQASLPSAVLNQAMAIKDRIVAGLMKQNRAFFGVGVGQSLDNPKEAVLVIFVDRQQVPATLPATISGIRTRYVIMDRLHVTRSYATGLQARSRCMSHAARPAADLNDPFHVHQPLRLNLF